MRIVHKIICVLLFNIIFVTNMVIGGSLKNDIYRYFQEKEAVTFLSALMLGLTSLCALTSALIRRRLDPKKRVLTFWALSAFGFFFLSMDEYFMMHEGMDTPLLLLLGKDPQVDHLDGLVFLILGAIAVLTGYKARKEISPYKDFIILFALGFICLGGMITFDILDQNSKVIKVIEESFKITGVTFFFTAYLSAMIAQLCEAIPEKRAS